MGNKTSKIKKIYAVWVYVRDFEESRKFYEKLIGSRVKFQEGDWIEFDLDGTSFGLLQLRKKGTLQPQKTHIMFQIDDIEAMQRKLEGSGVKLIGGIRNESYGKLLTFEDPNGHWLELFESNPQGVGKK
ncbi:MAG: VOC family protein [Candidatus Kerfeldbacteria bacterium]|nr:VOC family protein [Candidatus Kerfeldbacteria bacterium]